MFSEHLESSKTFLYVLPVSVTSAAVKYDIMHLK